VEHSGLEICLARLIGCKNVPWTSRGLVGSDVIPELICRGPHVVCWRSVRRFLNEVAGLMGFRR